MGCELQIGGSDQWGNIAQGVDLIRRREAAHVHALTWPLITRADGQKFGKSVSGAVWLDPERTSPYEFHQYWLNVDDRDIERFLLQLTLLSVDEINVIVAEHTAAPEARLGQHRLADEITTLIHGPDAVAGARRASEVLFGRVVPTAEDLESLRGVVPESSLDRTELHESEPFVDLLVEAGLVSSRREARQSLSDGAVRWNGEKIDGADQSLLAAGSVALLQRGKRNRHLIILR
jgi:tyrosyl-tRNA synthetase